MNEYENDLSNVIAMWFKIARVFTKDFAAQKGVLNIIVITLCTLL